jgi:hypothetical protein
VANDLASLLMEARHSVEYARATGVDHRDATTLHSIRIRFGRLVARGLAANPAPEVGKRSGYEKKAIILPMGKVSGTHLDPTVSIVFSLRGDFPGRRGTGYVVVQLVGAVLADLSLQSVIHVSALYGSKVATHLPGQLRPEIRP